MSVRKRTKRDGSYTWEFCITITKTPRKQLRKSGFKTRAEAVEAEKKAIIEIEKGFNITAKKTTFKELAELYLEKISNKSKSVNRNYRNTLNNHLQYFYNKKLKEITCLMVEAWVRDCNKTPNTIAECVKFAKAVFNYGVKHDFIVKNPFVRVERPKVVQKERKRLTVKEAISMLQKCKLIFPEFYPILATQIFTGLREGELLALKWRDLNFKTGKLKVCRQYTQGELKETLKTSSSYREIDVCPTLMKILREHLHSQDIVAEFMFTNSKGNLHNPRNLIQRKFEPLLEMMFGDRKYMRFYDLRGTYVDILLSQGVPLKYIQTQVGHANYLTTMNAYSKLVKDVNEHAVNVLEKTVSIL